MMINRMKLCTAIIQLLKLLISLLIVRIVNDICSNQLHLTFIICLCILSALKWIFTRIRINYYIRELKIKRSILLSNYFHSTQVDHVNSHLAKVSGTDLELLISYETEYRIQILFCFMAICIYILNIALNSILLSAIILVIGILQGIIPKLYESKFSSNYQKTCIVEEDIANFYYEIISHFEKCYFLPISYLSNILKEKNNDYMKIGIKSEATAQKYNGLMNALNILSQIGICFICLLLANAEKFQLSNLLGITFLSLQVINLFYEVFLFFQIAPAAKVAKTRISEIVDINPHTNFDAPNKSRKLLIIKGKNGAGKSTLLRKKLLSEKEEVFYVPQNELLLNVTPHELFAIFPDSTQSNIKTLFNWNDSLANRLLPTLSSGERKKVELMCAFMSNKRIYLDEPENTLDEDNKIFLLNAIGDYPYKIVIATNSSLYDALHREELYAEFI